MLYRAALGIGLLTLPLLAQPVSSYFLKGQYAIPNIGVAKNLVREYCRSPLYKEEIQFVVNQAREYLDQRLLRPVEGRPALVLDIDDTMLSNLSHMEETDFAFQPLLWNAWVERAKAPALEPVRDLVRQARAKQVAVIIISQRSLAQKVATETNLRQAGFEEWSELILKDPSSPASSVAFKTEQRRRVTQAGLRILVNLGDQDSDLVGGYAEAVFKLPNPMYWVP